ncbi:MAG: flavodoxin family protein, partial [Gammaproteobacteria bacterium]
MTQPDTIALFASSRRNGNTGAPLDAIAQPFGIEVVDLSTRNVSAFDYEHRNRTDDFEALMNHVLRFEQIIFASPIYWYSVASPMKIFLDRISDYLDLPDLLDKGRELRDKTGFVVCTSVYDKPCAPFIAAFEDTFNYLGRQYGGCINANCKHGYEAERYKDDVMA